ncbi:hypothetical protein PoMZ_11796 [Pyricularia oryzae]|uniref:Uncharacterized protein n=1 Tax=Pyricularia oryzae TaxID=318829 RepID=A0A4P7NL90_PYROR|nr:hypothetical protein PoMZ_11796 [Pyricularia oryzae]
MLTASVLSQIADCRAQARRQSVLVLLVYGAKTFNSTGSTTIGTGKLAVIRLGTCLLEQFESFDKQSSGGASLLAYSHQHPLISFDSCV